MKKKKLIEIAILIILVAVELLIGLQIFQLNIIPMKYFMMLVIAVIVIDLMIAGLVFSHNKKKCNLRRILGYFLSVLVVVVLLLASRGISKIKETMDAVTQTTQVSAVFELYVLKDDAADSLEDVQDYKIAVIESVDSENTKIVLDAMESSFGQAVQSVNYDNLFVMVDALYEKEIGALLINSAYVDLITEFENYTDFLKRVKCIWQYDIHQSVDIDIDDNSEKEIVVEEKSEYAPFIVYISGSDTLSRTLKTSRSDVNILAVVNPQTEQILLVNTPRDYYIPNPAGNGALDKLTHCGIYGINCSVQALSDLYDEEILYYGQINFTGFETLIDAIGGVDVYSDVEFSLPDINCYYKQGWNHLNGTQALVFARVRHGLKGGDNARGQNQMQVIKAVINQISAENIITNYSEIMDSLQGMFATNISSEKISSLVKLQLSEMPHWDVKSYAVTGHGDSAKTYSIPGMNAYVMRPNQETVDHAKMLINKVMSGEILTDVNKED